MASSVELSYAEFVDLANFGPLIGYLITDTGGHLILSTNEGLFYHIVAERLRTLTVDKDARVVVPTVS